MPHPEVRITLNDETVDSLHTALSALKTYGLGHLGIQYVINTKHFDGLTRDGEPTISLPIVQIHAILGAVELSDGSDA
jgi:hypothetical protein